MADTEATPGSATPEMTFWDHLDDLRSVLVRIAIVVAVLGVGAFIAMPWIFDHVIMAPSRPDFPLYSLLDASGAFDADSPMHVEIVSVELTSQFFSHMSAACWTTSPFTTCPSTRTGSAN
ncbi:MAG: twin-arginine translocase subunit TatC, partial [Muribaculaceae bacterium]|nr:twin-arginine translocase subunit TatC [Muribaculaceae bacterium]